MPIKKEDGMDKEQIKQQIQEMIAEQIYAHFEDQGEDAISYIETFEDAGVLSNDDGLIIGTRNGEKIHITIS